MPFWVSIHHFRQRCLLRLALRSIKTNSIDQAFIFIFFGFISLLYAMLLTVNPMLVLSLILAKITWPEDYWILVYFGCSFIT